MMQTSGSRTRFEFGRHETFPVRHGWLTKGLGRVQETGQYDGDLETADALGLGSRMAKSLAFWLEASGLAGIEANVTNGTTKRRRKGQKWTITELGEIVTRYDPHLEYPVTWWFVHMALAQRPGTVWGWFFNDFHERQFSREACLNAFLKHVGEHASNKPSEAVAQRDIACVLQAYALPSGGAASDPEDASVCPLRELGLLVRHSDVHRFEKAHPLDAVPVEAFIACAAKLASESGADSVRFTDLLRSRNGPARLLGLRGDQLEDMAEAATSVYGDQDVQVSLLGAERHLVIQSPDPRNGSRRTSGAWGEPQHEARDPAPIGEPARRPRGASAARALPPDTSLLAGHPRCARRRRDDGDCRVREREVAGGRDWCTVHRERLGHLQDANPGASPAAKGRP